MTTYQKDWILDARNEHLFKLEGHSVHIVLNNNTEIITGVIANFVLAKKAPYQICSIIIKNNKGNHEVSLFDIDSIEIDDNKSVR